MFMIYKFIGWVRDKKGKVVRYKFHPYSNCLASMCGGGHVDPNTGMGNTTPYILVNMEVINPLKGKTRNCWFFEQAVYDIKGIIRALKSSEGSGNIPKIWYEIHNV